MERRVKASSETTAFLLMLAIGLVLLNVLSVFYYTRIDLTERRLHSLSDGTKRLLSNLEDRLTVRAYFSKDLPPPFNSHERAVRDLLEEYESNSHGKLIVEIIHPDGNEELEEQAREEGVEKVAHTALQADQAHQVDGYRGVSFHYRGESDRIPVLQQRADISGLEYDFTTNIRRVVERATGEKRTIGFVMGHGEPGVNLPPPRRNQMEPEPEPGISYLNKLIDNYALREVTLERDKVTPDDFRGLMVVGPAEEIPDADLYAIDQFLMRGGSVAFFVNGVNVEESQMGINATTNANETGLDALLQTYGVQVGHDVVLDTQTDLFMVSVRTPIGNMAIPRPYPGWPHLSADEIAEDHALLFRLPGLTLLWPSTVRITREAAENENIEARVLARTTENAWSVRDNFDLDPGQEEDEWMEQVEAATSKGRFPLIVELKGRFHSHFAKSGRPARAPAEGEEEVEPEELEHLSDSQAPGRILVVGDADFMNIQYVGSQRRPRHAPSNLTFLMNTLDWLAEDEDLIEIRAKRLEDPSLPEMSDAKRNWIKWGNIIAWPMLFLIFGIIRWSWRKSARQQIEKDWTKGKKGGK